MAAAGLGRRLVSGVCGSSRLSLLGSRLATQNRPWLPVRCSVALTARGYSSNEGGSDCMFAKTHEWVRVDGNSATIGISNYAQDELGEVVYVEIPEVGTVVEQGEQLSVLESVKAVADVNAVVSGKVTGVNSALENSPSLINEQPFGDGWLAKLELANKEELSDLMTHSQYNTFIRDM